MGTPPALETLETDVLVIGGGVAGTWAAVAAARERVRVILAEKGYSGASGVAATAGPGHWWVPPDPSLREQAIARRLAIRHRGSKLDGGHSRYDLAYPSDARALLFFSQGRKWRHPIPSAEGSGILRAMRALVLDHGVEILDQSPASELLRRDDGSIAGARGWRRQRHRPWDVRAGTVVIATGGYAFKSRLLGAQTNTGDGHLMAAETWTKLHLQWMGVVGRRRARGRTGGSASGVRCRG